MTIRTVCLVDAKSPDPVPTMHPAITFGSLTLNTHLVVNLIAGTIFFLGVRQRVLPLQINQTIYDEIDGVFYMIIGIIVGAWLAYTLPMAVRYITGVYVPERWWMAGTHWMGFIAGGLVAGYFYARKRNFDFARHLDAFAPMLAIALAIGRIGCLAAGDAFGRVTDSWIAMYLPDVFGIWAERYPTQPVSLVINLLIAAMLFGTERFINSKPQRTHWYFDGFLFLSYILLFCGQRFYFEFWRGDMPLLFGPLTWTHLYCVIGIVLAVWAMVSGSKHGRLPTVIGDRLPAEGA